METLTEQKINYETYLQIDKLLSAQQLLSSHHDEMLFILIHQIYELWFKELLHELEEVIRCFQNGNIQRSIKVLKRIETIQSVLIKQIDVLETMTPTEFATFRDNLRPASGFQSVQFREVEFMSGLKNPKFLKFFEAFPALKERLEKRLASPTLYDYFLRLLKSQGFNIPETVLNRDVSTPYEANDDVLKVIQSIYQEFNRYGDLYLLCEALLNYDEQFNFWRYRHVKMVERTIGMKTGTGGSTGAQYLASTLTDQFFPELWKVRDLIGSY